MHSLYLAHSERSFPIFFNSSVVLHCRVGTLFNFVSSEFFQHETGGVYRSKEHKIGDVYYKFVLLQNEEIQRIEDLIAKFKISKFATTNRSLPLKSPLRANIKFGSFEEDPSEVRWQAVNPFPPKCKRKTLVGFA